ncbi:hypothetical protein LCGC14_2963180, partial [marine sediment metagenome]
VEAGIDSLISGVQNNMNAGSHDSIIHDVVYGGGEKLQWRRGIANFDVSALAGAIINSAKLVREIVNITTPGQLAILSRCTRPADWVELEVTWDNYKVGGAWTLVGGDFDDDSRLAADLGLDSLAGAEAVVWLHEEFGFAPANVEALQTVGDVMLAAAGEAVSAPPRPLTPVPARWFKRLSRPHRPEGLAEMTIPQAFLVQALAAPGAVAVADQASGVKTYRELLTGVLALAGPIRQLPGANVGILMPASVAANVLYLATLQAGKTPVMVNWTLGRRNLLHCLDSVGVRRILTAGKVVTRIEAQGTDLTAVHDRLLAVEDLAAALLAYEGAGKG